ncbi:hypothetical protein EGY25_08855 [Brevundimonas intermedia]|uniref:Cupin domain-containing protein n=1 Tax=Brevundimonas intermedia TaxID=74315 RepID=A0A4Y9RWY3_9CAUL|nr:hypothetical protein [Brevundimonas intermedia]TFW12149.1 hypothetical protein EGY25_08855 [Brevundimonas intermedia]
MIRPLASLTLVLVLATPVRAQQIFNFDAVAAAPTSHQVLLENESVRVLRVTIEPGATEPVHDHAWPSIMYFEKAQAITYISYELKNGLPVEARRIDAPAETLTGAVSSPPEGLHAVQNRGTETFTALRVEFKPQ